MKGGYYGTVHKARIEEDLFKVGNVGSARNMLCRGSCRDNRNTELFPGQIYRNRKTELS